MSGLEKFQKNAEWRAKLENHLLSKRTFPKPIKEPLVQIDHHKLDLTEDLAKAIKSKVMQKQHFASVGISGGRLRTEGVASSGTEISKMPDIKAEHKDGDLHMQDMTCFQQEAPEEISMCSQDESFETMEKMCEKTASDPNSTLFQYLHSENKENVLQSAKKRSQSNSNSHEASLKENNHPEGKAFLCLLKDLHMDGAKLLRNESPLQTGDVTQLDQIEPPSKLWDNTFAAENVSPVKMVGLLRPSTIIEESASNETCISTELSYKTAPKRAESVASSSFVTAPDSDAQTEHDYMTAQADSSCDELDKQLRAQYNNDSSNSTEHSAEAERTLAAEHNEPCMSIKKEREISTKLDFDEEVVNDAYDPDDESIDLIDLEQTFVEKEGAGKSIDFVECLSDESVIEVSDGSVSPLQMESRMKIEKKSLVWTESQLLESSNDMQCDDNENISLSDLEDNSGDDNMNASGDRSREFRDTLEEVEFLMQKGMQYMAQKAEEDDKAKQAELSKVRLPLPSLSDKAVPSPKLLKPFSPDIKQSPRRKLGDKSSPRYVSKASRISASFYDRIKPFPKLDIFKKNNNCSEEPVYEEVNYDYIISPICTYIHEVNTPLVSNHVAINEDEDDLSYFYKLALNAPENDASEEGIGKGKKLLQEKKKSQRSNALPKREYALAGFRHYQDLRQKMKIPGGKQYENVIEISQVPQVIKHQTKMKIADSVLGKRFTQRSAEKPVPITAPRTPPMPPPTLAPFMLPPPTPPPLPPPPAPRRTTLAEANGDVSLWHLLNARLNYK